MNESSTPPAEVNESLQEFARLAVKAGHWRSERRLLNNLDYLFREVPLTGRRFLDVGGGAGLFCAAARAMGAARAVCVEPGGAGASNFIRTVAAQGAAAGDSWGIEYEASTLEDYHSESGSRCQFDVILLHNVINHLDEEACIRLHRDEQARQRYGEKLQLLHDIAAPGAHLIICDCARNNLWSDLHLPNPLMRSIEWHKHQNPGLWRSLLGEGGWKHRATDWTTPNLLGRPGRLLGNALCSYFLFGHFRLLFCRPA